MGLSAYASRDRTALATGLIWGVWHYPLILAGGEPGYSRLVALLVFPVVTTVFAIFLGWLRLQTGSVWAGSVAHAANNGIEDNLNRLTFTGHLSGTVPTGAGFASILAEPFVLLSIVTASHIRRSPESVPFAAALTSLPMPPNADPAR